MTAAVASLPSTAPCMACHRSGGSSAGAIARHPIPDRGECFGHRVHGCFGHRYRATPRWWKGCQDPAGAARIPGERGSGRCKLPPAHGLRNAHQSGLTDCLCRGLSIPCPGSACSTDVADATHP